MCGRFAFYSPSEAAAALFGAHTSMFVEPRFNIAPTSYVAAIRNNESSDRELLMLRWGLIPSWAKDPAIGNRMINARAETVAEKPSFRAAYSRHRCVVLSDGFFEWRREGDVKTPWFVSLLIGDKNMLESAAEKCPPLRAWPVDRRVNNARNQGNELIDPDGEILSD